MDEEIRRAYDRDGWALVRGLVAPELAEGVRRRMEELGSDLVTSAAQLPEGQRFIGVGAHRAQHITHDQPERDELIRSVIFSPSVVDLAKDLLRVDAVRHVRTVVLQKEPEASGGAATSLHQDLCYLPFDRTGSVTIWMALTRVTPAMGPLVFVPGSQRFGPLGRDALARDGGDDRISAELERAGWSLTEPHEMAPGDVTVHADLTIHGAPPNLTDRDRWAIAMTFMRPDVLYTGAPWRLVTDLDLKPNEPFDHDRFALFA